MDIQSIVLRQSAFLRKGFLAAIALFALAARPTNVVASLALGVFVPAGSLQQVDDLATASSSPDGRVLACDATACQRFDPVSGNWDSPILMTDQHAVHTATALVNGRVLITGTAWQDTSSHPSAELFDPATSGFLPPGAMVTPRYAATAVRLLSGDVLVMSGRDMLAKFSAWILHRITDE